MWVRVYCRPRGINAYLTDMNPAAGPVLFGRLLFGVSALLGSTTHYNSFEAINLVLINNEI